jgi:hypothetical protein
LANILGLNSIEKEFKRMKKLEKEMIALTKHEIKQIKKGKK